MVCVLLESQSFMPLQYYPRYIPKVYTYYFATTVGHPLQYYPQVYTCQYYSRSWDCSRNQFLGDDAFRSTLAQLESLKNLGKALTAAPRPPDTLGVVPLR